MIFSKLKKILIIALSIMPLFSYSRQVYDHSLNNTVIERSLFYYETWPTGDYNKFLKEINRDTKIFIHFHGCGGIYQGDFKVKDEYLSLGGAVILVNFLKRPGVTTSCPGGKDGDVREILNPNRIDIRRKEAEVLVKDLQSKGYKNIYISGHSEGGKVASSWTLPVSGIVIHGMDCGYNNSWNIQRNQKTLVLFSWKDEWLTAQKSMASCQHFFNKDWVTEVTTNDISHAAFYNKIHVDAFRQWLTYASQN
jgi:hypothetical protein